MRQVSDIQLTWSLEREYSSRGAQVIVGIDEAGRGPLAGPVVAAAVVFPIEIIEGADTFGINDSKQLREESRERLFDVITAKCSSFGIGIVPPDEIDEINILQATMRAMTLAVDSMCNNISALPDMLLVDGHYFRTMLPYTSRTVIRGDAISPSIAAASILAKVTRDRLMCELDKEYPKYGFAKHKGYGTREHREAIAKYGLSAVHRKSFKLKSQPQLFS